MYSVTAPATACDFPKGNDPDNASQKNELKLVVPDTPSQDDEVILASPVATAKASDDSSDSGDSSSPGNSSDPDKSSNPSTLAAKILQMHATANDLKPTASRRPTLTDAPEETAFDMPGVLRAPVRGSRTNGLPPKEVPAPAAVLKAADNFRQGPSFTTLLLSTLLIVGIGTGAVLLSLSDLLAGKTPDSRSVQTQQIDTEPTIESLIAGAEPEFQGRTDLTATPTASAEQMKSAKDRIREVFASRSVASPTPEDHSNPLGHDTNRVADDKIQSRLAPVQPAPDKIDVQGTRGADTMVASAADGLTATDASPVPDLAPLEADTAAATTPAPASAAAPAPAPALAPAEDSAAGTAFPLAGTIRSSVNLREAQTKDATVLAVIPAGAKVRFNECGNWWCGVEYDGKTGYVGQSYLEPLPQP